MELLVVLALFGLAVNGLYLTCLAAIAWSAWRIAGTLSAPPTPAGAEVVSE